MSASAQSRSPAWLRAAGPGLAVLAALAVAACAGDEPTPTAAQPADTPGSAATLVPDPTTQAARTPAATPAVPTPTPGQDEFVLHIVEPVAAETLTTNATLLVSGRTRVDAVLTVNDTFVDPDVDGMFSTELTLEAGPNIIEVVASIATGEELSAVLVVIYEP